MSFFSLALHRQSSWRTVHEEQEALCGPDLLLFAGPVGGMRMMAAEFVVVAAAVL